MRTSISLSLVALMTCSGAGAAIVGCGGPTLTGDDYLPPDAGDATTQSDASDAGTTDATDDGPFACGSLTCQSGELCFKPCSGGVQQCEPTDDAGTCPPGTHTSSICSMQGSNNPCEPDPPPPYCSAGPCDAGLFWAQSGRVCMQLCQ